MLAFVLIPNGEHGLISSEQLDKFWKKYSEDIERHVSRTQKERVEVQENLLILFRMSLRYATL